MDHTEISSSIDASTVATLSVRLPQLPTSSSELSQQISNNTRNISRPCLNRVLTCVPTNRWIPDSHATQCMAPDCQQQFTFFNRKHHCRVCGKIYCTNCCSKQLSAPAVYAAPLTTEETNKQQYYYYSQQQQQQHQQGAAAVAAAAAPSAVGGGSSPRRSPSHGRSQSAGRADGGSIIVAADGSSVSVLSPRQHQHQHQQQTSSSSAIVGGGTTGLVAAGGDASAVGPGATSTAIGTTNGSNISGSGAALPSTTVVVKVCRECYYDHQLAVSRRDIATAEPRRRHRGELKMLQRARLLDICSFLPLEDLFRFSLVCSDFYFITRDNAIWIIHNATRWPDKRLMGKAAAPPASLGSAGGGTSSTAVAAFRPNSDDDLSYHCSYNFTQFLHYCHLLEATRCEGLSNFANSARVVLSGYVKVAVIGPENVGKTLLIQRFLNGGPACVAPSSGPVPPQMASSVYPLVPAGPTAVGYRPTAGIAVSQKSVVIAGGLSLDASGLTIIDVGGSGRYDKLRAMACRGAHAIVMCYSVHSKKSLIEAAMQAFAMEQELGPQPIIVCGIAGQGPHEVTPLEAAPSSGRGRASIQVAPTAQGGSEVFSAAVQAILEKLMDGGRHASELLALSQNPSVLDVLLDLKG